MVIVEPYCLYSRIDLSLALSHHFHIFHANPASLVGHQRQLVSPNVLNKQLLTDTSCIAPKYLPSI